MSNDDQLKVRQTVSKKKSFKELTIIRDTIFWIDVVGEGQNQNAIFARPFNVKEAFPQQLTSKKYNIKNNFHGYGGKSYKCINFKNNFYLIWIDEITKAVWFQIFKEAALKMTVTPSIIGDGNVLLDIQVNNDTPNRSNPGDPAINKMEIATKLLVADGDIVVIGGIKKNTLTNSKQQTPGVGDVPVVGNLFKGKQNTDNMDELLVFIAPRIL